ncbi:MAG TPA: glycosyl hydrolase 108 family protein [Tepidisphaeraceae bacterium]
MSEPDDLFLHALAHVLAMEGGYTDDPYDPGGPTNLGITLADYARNKGVALDAGNFARFKAELRSIPRDTVRRIYYEFYWQPACCPQLPAALAFFHFDAAVNQGVARAARMLQEAVGAVVDGVVGPETLAAAAAAPPAAALARYADIRRRHYRSLATFWRFGRGWLARVDRALAAATALASARTAPGKYQLPHQPKEPTTMTEQPQPAETPAAAKWWGSSMTVWGAVLTALTTVLPVVGPLFGLNITADLVQQVGDQVVVLVQAAGGLAGTILTIYGRARATTVLERRQITLSM